MVVGDMILLWAIACQCRLIALALDRNLYVQEEQHAQAWGLSAQRAIKEYFSFKSRLRLRRGGQR